MQMKHKEKRIYNKPHTNPSHFNRAQLHAAPSELSASCAHIWARPGPGAAFRAAPLPAGWGVRDRAPPEKRRREGNRKSLRLNSCGATKATIWENEAQCQWPHTLQPIWVSVFFFFLSSIFFFPLACVHLPVFTILPPPSPWAPLPFPWHLLHSGSFHSLVPVLLLALKSPRKTFTRAQILPHANWKEPGGYYSNLTLMLLSPVPLSWPLNVTTDLKAYVGLKRDSRILA